MTDKPDADSKTEPASEKRIREAIEKGNVPISRELTTLAFLVALLVSMYFIVGQSGGRLASTLSLFLEKTAEWEIGTSGDIVAIGRAVATGIVLALAPFLIALLVAGVGSSMLQMPPQLNIDKLKPDPSRISPLQGWKRIASSQGVIELVRAVVKLGVLSGIAVVAFTSDWFGLAASLQMHPYELPGRVLAAASALLVAAIGFAAILAVLDLLVVRVMWQKNLKMTKREVKDEHRQAEGDPLLKARRRSVALSRSRQSMLAAVPRATVVVANPTHFAVALSYRRAEGGAPKVVAKGRDLLALKIRAVAEANDIPVVEDRDLARALHGKVEVGQVLPPEFYRLVADLLIALQKRGRIRL